MLGRFLALIGGAAMGALAALLYDPGLYGPQAPQVTLGEYEAFRQLMIFGAGLLALCGVLGAFQPAQRAVKRATAPSPLAEEPPAAAATEPSEGREPDAFRLSASPSASPLW